MKPSFRDWLYMLALGAAFGLLTSCARGRGESAPQPGYNTKQVLAAISYQGGRPCEYETMRCWDGVWRNSPYSRHEDVVGPPFLILSGDGTACPVFEFLLRVPRRGDLFTCSEPWRTRR